jgi:hypothetical protein
MVIDGQTLITGSFNFTKAAEENNAENLLVIRSPELAAKYAANWQVHSDHSDPYASRTEGYSETHRAESAKPAAPAAAPVTEGHVASKNSQVFHRAACNSVAKISQKNLVRYNTRDEAIQEDSSIGGVRPAAVEGAGQERIGDSSMIDKALIELARLEAAKERDNKLPVGRGHRRHPIRAVHSEVASPSAMAVEALGECGSATRGGRRWGNSVAGRREPRLNADEIPDGPLGICNDSTQCGALSREPKVRNREMRRLTS